MTGNGLSNFFLGLGIGVGVGMLFAPKSGEETRGMLKQKADESLSNLKQKGSSLVDSAGEYVEKGKHAIQQQKDNLSDAVEAGKQAYRHTVQAGSSVSQGNIPATHL